MTLLGLGGSTAAGAGASALGGAGAGIAGGAATADAVEGMEAGGAAAAGGPGLDFGGLLKNAMYNGQGQPSGGKFMQGFQKYAPKMGPADFINSPFAQPAQDDMQQRQRSFIPGYYGSN